MARRGKRGAPAAVTLLAGVVAVAAAFIIGQSSDSFGLAVSSGFGRQALVASAVSEAARETGSAQNGGSSPRGDDAFVEVSGQLQRPTSPSVSPSPQANAAAIERGGYADHYLTAHRPSRGQYRNTSQHHGAHHYDYYHHHDSTVDDRSFGSGQFGRWCKRRRFGL